MKAATLLLRQVHPHWFKDGHVLSIAFRPFPKDAGLLSVYDGEQIQPEPAWKHYTETLGHSSSGVWAVSVAETNGCDLDARLDAAGHFAEHAVIDFTKHGRNLQAAKSKLLAAHAETRGCLFAKPTE